MINPRIGEFVRTRFRRDGLIEASFQCCCCDPCEESAGPLLRQHHEPSDTGLHGTHAFEGGKHSESSDFDRFLPQKPPILQAFFQVLHEHRPAFVPGRKCIHRVSLTQGIARHGNDELLDTLGNKERHARSLSEAVVAHEQLHCPNWEVTNHAGFDQIIQEVPSV